MVVVRGNSVTAMEALEHILAAKRVRGAIGVRASASAARSSVRTRGAPGSRDARDETPASAFPPPDGGRRRTVSWWNTPTLSIP